MASGQRHWDSQAVASQPVSAADEARAFDRWRFAYEATLELFTATSAQQIVEALGRILSALFPFAGCALLSRDPLSGLLYPSHSNRLSPHHEGILYDPDGLQIGEWAIQQGRIAILPTEAGSGGTPCSSVWVPLTARGEAFGLLFILLELAPERITGIEYNLLQLVATQAALALESRRLLDETELQAEAIRNVKAYLESILESMPNGLLVTDLEGRIHLLNRTAAWMLQLDPEGTVGLTVDQVLRPDQAHWFLRAVESAREGQTPEGSELEVPRGEEKLPLRLAPSLFLDGEGKVSGVIFALIDLREERELRELRRLDQLKDQFISAVSHELRTPITAIKSFAEILLTYDDPEHRREFLEIISRESDRLARIVNDILDLSKIDSGTMHWEIEDFDLREAIIPALDTLKPLAIEKSIDLELETREACLLVRADRERLVQVLVNLVGNAIKFTPEGGKVSVGYEILQGRRRTDLGDFAKVWVRDTGIGIPKRFIPLIFDRFQQVVEGRGLTNRPKGTGLGLPISKEIIEHLGGNIWVESEEGKGSTFYFTVPLAPTITEVTRFAESASGAATVPEKRGVAREPRQSPPRSARQ
ncbi:MAG: ATP-binding protein [candidate division KSB1 bacterium]|nr:ATP-binding protein [candidate division KSB1 bacterium]